MIDHDLSNIGLFMLGWLVTVSAFIWIILPGDNE